jgi:hypothetical protein
MVAHVQLTQLATERRLGPVVAEEVADESLLLVKARLSLAVDPWVNHAARLVGGPRWVSAFVGEVPGSPR